MHSADTDYIWIKQTLKPKDALQCAQYIANRPPHNQFYYDFSKMQHCPPFGVLAIVNAIRANMKKYPHSEHIPTRISETQGCNYARSLGLFKALGWEDGKKNCMIVDNLSIFPLSKLHLILCGENLGKTHMYLEI